MFEFFFVRSRKRRVFLSLEKRKQLVSVFGANLILWDRSEKSREEKLRAARPKDFYE